MATGEGARVEPDRYGAGAKWFSLIVTVGCLMFGATVGALGFAAGRGRLARPDGEEEEGLRREKASGGERDGEEEA
ncbi:hypothetical protein CDD83_5784 [Cordyceps sp. RAO-2017]|nr:hypothetical protein CDD83_5784 [Cordyceps sp. RAO-2017]